MLVSKIAPELALKVGRAGGRGIFCADTPLSVALTLIREGLTEEASLAPARKRRAELLMSIKSLVPAEHEVFRWVLSGVANKMIAKRLRVSQRTIEARRQKVFRKLSVASLAELVRLTALYADIEDLRIDVEPEEPTSMHTPI